MVNSKKKRCNPEWNGHPDHRSPALFQNALHYLGWDVMLWVVMFRRSGFHLLGFYKWVRVCIFGFKFGFEMVLKLFNFLCEGQNCMFLTLRRPLKKKKVALAGHPKFFLHTGDTCFSCQKVIAASMMEAMGRKYHPECFRPGPRFSPAF